LWYYHVEIGNDLKQWDNMPRNKYFISVVLGIQVPFDNDEISAKSMKNACPDQNRSPTPENDLVKVRSSMQSVHFSTVY
jgi:hypothetical protein